VRTLQQSRHWHWQSRSRRLVSDLEGASSSDESPTAAAFTPCIGKPYWHTALASCRACLQVLYLHSNNIARVAEVAKLAALPKLAKLTLHGNPVTTLPNYRMATSHHLTSLRSLDFTAFTTVDRESVAKWSRGHARRLAARS
jgi:Leucine-rich repeat (LRR) protein